MNPGSWIHGSAPALLSLGEMTTVGRRFRGAHGVKGVGLVRQFGCLEGNLVELLPDNLAGV